MKFPVEELKEWFSIYQRKLPWRENRSPYRVFVSEVMLQQTQAVTVIPYFERWMERFPDIFSLAEAKELEVMKFWEGLGYYSRARALHQGAKVIVQKFKGKFPEDEEGLLSIKGIGPYTTGAILSFAFQKRAAAIDGNVARVLSRFFGMSDPKEILKKVESFLPEVEPWVVNEAMIECGALICQRKPECQKCPLKKGCFAFKADRIAEFPKKKQGAKTTHLHRAVAIIYEGDYFLLKHENEKKVMQGLYEFPYVENSSLEDLKAHFEKEYDLDLTHEFSLDEETHTFTRFRAHLYPHCFKAKKRGSGWKKRNEVEKLPFSSGHKRILKKLLNHENFAH